MDFNSLLKLMVHKKASDLFITAGVAPSLKINGKITPVTQATLTPSQAREIVFSIMSPDQRQEFDSTRECNFAISASGIGRFRVSAFQQRNHAGMVLRKIETKIPTIEELTLPPIIKDIAMTKRGLVIFVGATGSGKSTSLASMIGYRNKNSTGHIISIEDPIEYIHQHEGCIVTQREVGLDTQTFEVALKNTLRQAPDVILIGEIRTRETMDHAIAFAESGPLGRATVHATTANQARAADEILPAGSKTASSTIETRRPHLKRLRIHSPDSCRFLSVTIYASLGQTYARRHPIRKDRARWRTRPY